MFSDLKYALRSLSKSPGFVAVALATLVIGIGANTAIFSFVNGFMLKPLPYADPDRVVVVHEKRPDGHTHDTASTLNYLDWKKENSVFQFMAALTGGSVTLTGVDQPVQIRASRVSADYFKVFGVKAAVGRTFAAGEDQPGNDKVVVISHAFWQSQFGGERSMLGRALTLDNEPYTVIGILPKGSVFDRIGWPKIWRPLAFTSENRTRNFHWLSVSAKLKPGVTLEQARANMNTLGARIAQNYPDSNKGWGVTVDLFADVLRNNAKTELYLLLAAVGMVLLIGCANVANLMFARGMVREREVAIRIALGAGSWQLVRQFLAEGLLLSLTGGVLGLAVGCAAMAGLKSVLPPYAWPDQADLALDGRVLLFTLLLSVFTGVLCGLAPTLQSRRPELTSAMKQGGAGVGRVRQRTRAALVIAEVALAFLLLAGAGLLLRSFAKLQYVDTGFDATNVITAGFPIPQQRFAEPEAFTGYLRQVREAVAALPGVRDAAFTSSLPLQYGFGMPFQRADKPVVDPVNRVGAIYKTVSPTYFQTLGLKLIEGRTLTERDTQGALPAMVINETLRRKYFADADPIGKRILIQEIAFGRSGLGQEIPWEVVGVVADEKIGWLGDKEDQPAAYVTTEQNPQLMQSLLVRTESDPALLYQPLRAAVKRINPDQPLSEMKTLEQIKTESLGDNQLITTLLGIFAGVALLLAAIGIYGVISYSVAQRTREIGVRAALGADAGNILRLVLRSGMKTVTIGLLIGAAGVFALARVLSSLLFGVDEHDPLTFVSVAVLLAVTALIACYLPARRATKIDPLVALRAE